MSWPQWVVAFVLVYSFVRDVVRLARDKDLSSGEVTIAVFLTLAFVAAYAGVLHAGGFW